MEHDFWHQKWEKCEIGFHQAEANSMLVRHLSRLDLPPDAQVFLPLCGKTLDIGWLLGQGYRVIGSELSAIAIRQLFEDLRMVPDVSQVGPFSRYDAEGIAVFVGDFFNLTREMIGPVDAVYDRAALVALPEDMRGAYAAHMAEITDCAMQFLLSFEYDQSRLNPPPFSVGGDELRHLYGARYVLSEIDRGDVKGGLKGVCPAEEVAWFLRARRQG